MKRWVQTSAMFGVLLLLSACGSSESDVREAVIDCWKGTRGIQLAKSHKQVEVADVNIQTHPLSPADQKNGITWKGPTYVRFTYFSARTGKHEGGSDMWFSEVKNGDVIVKPTSLGRPICS